MEYTRVPPGFGHPEPASVPVNYAVSVLANPAGALAGASILGAVPQPGDTVAPRPPSPDLSAVAGWRNVVATVHSPSGAPLPGSIRLDFEVAYTSPDAICMDNPWGPFPRRDQTLSIGREVDGYATNFSCNLPGEGGRILDGQAGTVAGPDGLLHLGFHLDLAVSAEGVSDQFTVALASRMPALLDITDVDNLSVMNLTLKGITLPDGTGLEEAGYTIGFESGRPDLPWQTVPEPWTWLAWTCLAAASTRILRRRRAS